MCRAVASGGSTDNELERLLQQAVPPPPDMTSNAGILLEELISQPRKPTITLVCVPAEIRTGHRPDRSEKLCQCARPLSNFGNMAWRRSLLGVVARHVLFVSRYEQPVSRNFPGELRSWLPLGGTLKFLKYDIVCINVACINTGNTS
jgi:hypothetical protein